MSCLTEDRAAQLLGRPPHVYVRTLGGFRVEVDSQLVVCQMRGIGAPQMRLPLGYLIARRDQPIRRDVLLEIARRRSDHPPRHVLSALLRLLTSWDMADAVAITDESIMLKRHPIWGTDTDALQRLWHAAAQAQASGEHLRSLVILQHAEQLYGGRYMPFYDSLPDYAITGEVDYWQEMQKDLLLKLADMHLALTSAYPCAEALRVAGHAVEIDQGNPSTCLAAAAIARRCGNQTRARFYENKAKEYDEPPYNN